MSATAKGPFGGPKLSVVARAAHRGLPRILGALALLALVAVATGWMVAACRPRGVAASGAAPSQSLEMLPRVRRVDLPYRGYGMARVVGDALFVTVDTGSGALDTLVRHDLQTSETRTILTLPTDIAWIAVNERWLLWESEKTLHAGNLEGGDDRVLASGREAYAPGLEGDTAVWVDGVDGLEAEVVAHDLAADARRTLGRTHLAEFYNNFLQIREGQVLWTDIFDGTGHYLLFDLATGEVRDYPVPETRFSYPGYGLRTGSTVYSINFDRYDEWDWDSQQLTRYSLESQSAEPVQGVGTVNALVVGEGAIAVIDARQHLLIGAVEESGPLRDMTATLGGGVDTIQVSSDRRTAVAGRSLPDRDRIELFVFELSAN